LRLADCEFGYIDGFFQHRIVSATEVMKIKSLGI